MSELGLRRTILGYINRAEKAKLCILDIFLKKEKLSEYEARELIARYYLVKLYNITKIYNELKSDGLILYNTTSGKD
jgi:hypothetical protein